ncbi:MAG TPA: hypothetical protein VFZ25_06855, partial [Chloroflexota bacterium]|nr:hypothetical protein [Chloroflexota bacterium]
SLSLMEGRVTRQLLSSPPSLNVIARPRSFRRPAIPHATSVDLGGKAFLIGYDLTPTGSLAPGTSLALTLYWRAANNFGVSYKVFTHLVGPDGQIRGQKDSLPLDGAAPTTSWAPGEFLTDRYEIPIDTDAPAGMYQVIVGMYDGNTGARLPISGGKADQIVVTKVEVGAGQ